MKTETQEDKIIFNKIIHDIIIRLLKKWDRKGHSAYSINCGNCDAFAEEIFNNFIDGETMWGEEHPELFKDDICPQGHCFFAYDDLYYDSEAPSGVTSPDQLPFYQRAKLVGSTRNNCEGCVFGKCGNLKNLKNLVDITA